MCLLGVFLSGGIDSSTIVALIRQVSNNKIKTFSIGFEEKGFNELDYARAVAQRFETEHHELVVKMRLQEILPKLVYFFDEPFADSSAIPLYYLSEMTRQYVTVALSGDGGDELFAGYETYSAYKLANLYKQLPSIFSRYLIPALVKRLPVSHNKVSFDYKAKRFIDGALVSPELGHYLWKVIFTEEMKEELLHREIGKWKIENGMIVASFAVMKDYFAVSDDLDMLSKLQYADLKVYLPDDILTKVDRMSMAHSLEVRPPFLDHNLVGYAFSIPSPLKLNGFRKKYILKRMMNNMLPDKVLHSQKRGFDVPIPSWLRGELGEVVMDLLSPGKINQQGFFDPQYISKILKDHFEKKVDYSRNIWGLLVFTLWHDRWMKH